MIYALLERMKYAARWLINARDRDAVEEGIEEIEELREEVEKLKSQRPDDDSTNLNTQIEVDDDGSC